MKRTTKQKRPKARAKPRPDVDRSRKIVTPRALPLLNVALAVGATLGLALAAFA